MKKLIAATLLSTLVGFAAYGQGTLNFANAASAGGVTVNAPDFLNDGATKLSGSTYVAVLMAGASATSLSQIATTPYGTGGYFFGGTKAIPGIAGGGTAWVEILAFNTTFGATYAAAVASGQPNAYGGSSPFSVVLADPTSSPPGTPSALGGLKSFNLNPPVPEPSTFALAGLGAAALMIFRRRK